MNVSEDRPTSTTIRMKELSRSVGLHGTSRGNFDLGAWCSRLAICVKTEHQTDALSSRLNRCTFSTLCRDTQGGGETSISSPPPQHFHVFLTPHPSTLHSATVPASLATCRHLHLPVLSFNPPKWMAPAPTPPVSAFSRSLILVLICTGVI
ncbi:hypothetical protein K432DRAFT_223085 [Lepidopterella palustris CBS 459.81]|uniref:Uncharacterized protein n=1 Tax=Lepidopterella palustris CBS 459.81 TaxID=1314670 RepID=A0A8E2DXY2_9PEZI|nr:hypothetical protein K432DRAFT_223085 [Lepidopterella palustris CBS 459.81]